MQACFSEGTGRALLARALGWDDAPPEADAADDSAVQKGISKERTFRPTAQPEELRAHLHALCGALGAEMTERGLRGATLACACPMRVRTHTHDHGHMHMHTSHAHAHAHATCHMH